MCNICHEDLFEREKIVTQLGNCRQSWYWDCLIREDSTGKWYSVEVHIHRGLDGCEYKYKKTGEGQYMINLGAQVI